MAGPVTREPCRTVVVRVSVKETTDPKPRENAWEALFYAAIGAVVLHCRTCRRLSAVDDSPKCTEGGHGVAPVYMRRRPSRRG